MYGSMLTAERNRATIDEWVNGDGWDPRIDWTDITTAVASMMTLEHGTHVPTPSQEERYATVAYQTTVGAMELLATLLRASDDRGRRWMEHTVDSGYADVAAAVGLMIAGIPLTAREHGCLLTLAAGMTAHEFCAVTSTIAQCCEQMGYASEQILLWQSAVGE